MNDLSPNFTPGSKVTNVGPDSWTLEIPPASKGKYHLAQLDDYTNLKRRSFPWKAPFTLSLRARACAANIAGTWGFGFWNDPFSLSLGFGGGLRKFPALPNAAWFFYASSENYLSVRDDIPAHGFLAATFNSSNWAPFLMSMGLPAFPFLFWKPTARIMRPLASKIVRQDAVQLDHDVTQWHHYALICQRERVTFFVDDASVFESSIAPNGPLGFVLWVDNQFAALPPGGGLSFGTLATATHTRLEVAQVQITPH